MPLAGVLRCLLLAAITMGAIVVRWIRTTRPDKYLDDQRVMSRVEFEVHLDSTRLFNKMCKDCAIWCFDAFDLLENGACDYIST